MKYHLQKKLRNLRILSTIIIVVLFSLSLWQLATAGWIQGKAMVAQQLLKRSWQQTMDNASHTGDDTQNIHKPWPWADTWPVAKLLLPEHGIEQIVLAGDAGNSLAFGPGLSFAGAPANTAGTTIISAHRDTHFNFLKDLKINDIIYLQTADSTVQYRINGFQIVNSKNFSLQNNRHIQSLVLVTCYPFNALTAGGALRYLVYATTIDLTDE